MTSCLFERQRLKVHARPAAQDAIRAALIAADWPLLVRLCRQALRKTPTHLVAHRYLGFALYKLQDPTAALQAFRAATAHWPTDAELLTNHINVLLKLAHHRDALPLAEKLCQLRPAQSQSWAMLAQCCYGLQLHARGFEVAEKAMALARDVDEKTAALIQKAIHRRELGQVQEAVKDCEAAITLNPQEVASHTNRLLFMLADPDANAARIAAAARAYAAAYETPLKAGWPSFSTHPGEPWRRLKIGFLSPDFRTHAVMYFVEGLLAQLDRRQFEVFAFYLHPQDDAITHRVQRHADHFVRLADLPAAEQAQTIRTHQIDILIDLAGHTGGNGLPAMAHKAAPIQVSWLGYPATTGLDAVDYKFTDNVTDPPGCDAEYSEQLYRLPTFYCCYRPMSRNPLWRYQPRYLVQPSPALTKGYVTFGSCNNLGKLTDEVLSLWGQILLAVPGSHLLIEGKNLGHPDFADAYRDRCSRLGIDSDRLELVGLDIANQYLTYHHIDIALDPFPLTGGTTSFDLLWMGVPMVSMDGESFKSRMGSGLLTVLNHTEWLAHRTDEYVQIACRLAADPQQLNTIRQQLRPAMEQSILMREDIFCHHFGEGLRVMWLHWLANRQHPNDQTAMSQAIEQWLTTLPSDWRNPPALGVGIAPGQRISLAQAHQRLQALVDKAKAQAPQPQDSGQLKNRHWIELTTFAETVLDAVPNDAVALTCLAEVELAHGHADFAVTYLRYAQEALVAQG